MNGRYMEDVYRITQGADREATTRHNVHVQVDQREFSDALRFIAEDGCQYIIYRCKDCHVLTHFQCEHNNIDETRDVFPRCVGCGIAVDFL